MQSLESEVGVVSVGPFFRFPNESIGMTALRNAKLLSVDEDGREAFITASHSHCLDVLGEIRIGGEWDPETGEVITEPTLLEGWHVNYIGELPEGWEQYVVSPEQPVRIFA